MYTCNTHPCKGYDELTACWFKGTNSSTPRHHFDPSSYEGYNGDVFFFFNWHYMDMIRVMIGYSDVFFQMGGLWYRAYVLGLYWDHVLGITLEMWGISCGCSMGIDWCSQSRDIQWVCPETSHIYHLAIGYSSPWKIHPFFKNGKPSISINGPWLPWRTVNVITRGWAPKWINISNHRILAPQMCSSNHLGSSTSTTRA